MSTFLAFRSAAISTARPKAYYHHLRCLYSTRHAIKIDASTDGKTISKYKQKEKTSTWNASVANPPLTKEQKAALAKGKEIKREPQLHQKDEEIPLSRVQFVDPQTGALMPPTSLRDLVESIDRTKMFVELVSLTPAPIVRLVNKADVFAKQKLQRIRAKTVAKNNIQKEVQLTWGAAAGDLEHKLAKIREQLEKGYRLDVIYAPKKGQPLPTPDEMRALVEETVVMFADVAREWKPREAKKTITAIFFQGIAQAEPAAKQAENIPKGIIEKRLRREREEKRKKEQLERKEREKDRVLTPSIN